MLKINLSSRNLCLPPRPAHPAAMSGLAAQLALAEPSQDPVEREMAVAAAAAAVQEEEEEEEEEEEAAEGEKVRRRERSRSRVCQKCIHKLWRYQ